jgi:hypothetical protein
MSHKLEHVVVMGLDIMMEGAITMATAIAIESQNRGTSPVTIEIVELEADKANTTGSPVEMVAQEEEDTMVVERGMKTRKIHCTVVTVVIMPAMSITMQMKVDRMVAITITMLVEAVTVVAMTITMWEEVVLMVAAEVVAPEGITKLVVVEEEEAVTTSPTRTQTTTVSAPMTFCE